MAISESTKKHIEAIAQTSLATLEKIAAAARTNLDERASISMDVLANPNARNAGVAHQTLIEARISTRES
jgi:hypothetical protein